MKGSHIRELSWLIPFACIGLMALSLLRPLPEFSAPAQGRIVVDAGGVPVHIALPFKGTVLTWGGLVREYLHDTRAPETLLNAGGAGRREFLKEVIGWIYPRLAKRESVWDAGVAGSYGRAANSEVESLMALDAGAYLGMKGINNSPVSLLRRIGLPTLHSITHPRSEDERFFTQARVETAVIGHPERGEELIANYCRAFAELERELQPTTLTMRPRVLLFGGSRRDWRVLYVRDHHHSHQIYVIRAGLENAAYEYEARRPDAERILAMEPDMIFLMERSRDPETVQEFMGDPRWRGLKAVHEKRVYRMPGTSSADLAIMQYRPLWTRWMAEIGHPERMRPRLRQMLRESFVREFGYRLTDDQIDVLLRIDENKDSAGYERFTRNYQAGKEKRSAR